MVSISSVSTMLAPQTAQPIAPAPTNQVAPKESVPPAVASSSSGDTGSATDFGSGSGSQTYAGYNSGTKAGQTGSDALAKSILDAKTDTQDKRTREDVARRFASAAMQNARSKAIFDQISPSMGGSANVGNGVGNSVGESAIKDAPLPLPTADILLKFTNGSRR